MQLTEKQHQYQSHIAAAEEAGMRPAVYAREHRINVQCLYGDKNRLLRKERERPGKLITPPGSLAQQR